MGAHCWHEYIIFLINKDKNIHIYKQPDVFRICMNSEVRRADRAPLHPTSPFQPRLKYGMMTFSSNLGVTLMCARALGMFANGS
jgi:hypothetical protein